MLDLAGTAKCVGTALAETEVFDFTGPLQLCHHADGLFDGDVCIDAVAVVEVDVVDTKTLQGLVARLTDVVRVVAYLTGAIRSDPIGELCGKEDVVTLASSLEPSAVRKYLSAEFVGEVRLGAQSGLASMTTKRHASSKVLDEYNQTYFPRRSSLSPYMSALSQLVSPAA